MVARHQYVLVGTAKNRYDVDYDIMVICLGGPMDRHPLHSICIGPQQVERMLSVVLASALDTLEEIVPAPAKLLQGMMPADLTITC